MENPELKFIGRIVSPATDSGALPMQGVGAQAHIFDEYSAALDDIDEHSHIWLLCWLHEADRDRLKVVPRRIKTASPPKGVFSLRSPVRPNPIGLTATRLLKREGNVLFLEHIDFIDGTPIVDIKPYSVGWDSIFSAGNNSTYATYAKMDVRDAYDDMLRQAANFHGDACIGTTLGMRAAYLAMNHFKCDLQTKSLKVTVAARGCIADAVQGSMQAGNKRFTRLEPPVGEIVFIKDDARLELTVTPTKFASVEAVLAAPDKEVFSRIAGESK
ncbi:MAG: tRNA (N6-threonylcarbamoyladenosine(37)-N6)-methyltransferase TrmO [Actinomycetota bacterium]|nr:tRNA (N6-threonylcarbamoyladenosine(37)-N6)-methyltransferase TrmO [Actinomycetota bacterium]